MNINKFIRKTHLWLGLSSAIILFVVCISGSLFVYADEIMNIYNRNLSKVEPQSQVIPIEIINKKLRETYPDYKLSYFIAYKENDRAIKFLLFNKQTGLLNVFVNPYTGQITGDSRCIYFFYLVAHLHGELLLGPIGSWIVKIASIIFLIELITGIVLWWPRNMDKKHLKAALTIKRKMPFKRQIYDQHRVLGFYFLGILLLLTFTGLIIAFEPLTKMVSKSVGGDPDHPTTVAPDSTRKALPLMPTISHYLSQPGVNAVQVGLFNMQQTSVYRLATIENIGILTRKGDVHFIDKYLGTEVKLKSAAMHLETQNMLMRLHTGKWFGAFGEIITFVSGLIGAFLVLSGCIIWWNRRRGFRTLS